MTNVPTEQQPEIQSLVAVAGFKALYQGGINTDHVECNCQSNLPNFKVI